VRRAAAVAIGIVTFVLSSPLERDTRILLAYDLAIAAFLVFLIVRMSCADGAATRELGLVSFLNVTIILGLVVEIVSTFAGRAVGGP
jgi:hypothetical protein